jgi:2-polyprenyl-6-methoxyphenol hydroxylase-like FAD-dependent oxidoreductase
MRHALPAALAFLLASTTSAHAEPESYDLLVVGSGPGGLTSALAALGELQRHGGVRDAAGNTRAPRILVVEKRGDDVPDGADSGATAFSRRQQVSIKASAAELLRDLGVELPRRARVRSRAVPVRGPPAAPARAAGASGAGPSDPLLEEGSTHVVPIHDLQRLLLARVRQQGIRVDFDTSFDEVDYDSSGDAKVRLRGPGGAARTLRARWVIGADGGGSQVRQAAGIQMVQGDRQGLMAGVWFRGVRGGSRILYQDRTVPARTATLLGDSGRLYGLFPLPPEVAGLVPAGQPVPSRATAAIRAHAERTARDLLPAREGRRARADDVTTFQVRLDRAEHAVRNRVILTGDAVQLVNPLSGAGANLAMLMGAEAGRTVADLLVDPARGKARLARYDRLSIQRARAVHHYSRQFAPAFESAASAARPARAPRQARKAPSSRRGAPAVTARRPAARTLPAQARVPQTPRARPRARARARPPTRYVVTR